MAPKTAHASNARLTAFYAELLEVADASPNTCVVFLKAHYSILDAIYAKAKQNRHEPPNKEPTDG